MNTRLAISSFLAIALLVCCLIESDVRAEGVVVYGTVTNRFNQPVPGLTVSLFHPVFGRSNPSFTNASGRYSVYGVPVHQSPYYIEVFWGYQLIYRARIQVWGPVVWHIRIN